MKTQKRKVLIVDDERGFTNMLSLNLESTGKYEVRVENSSERAVEAAVQFQPDIILLDVVMPNIEGPDVAAAMKQVRELKQVPIVFLTATITKDEVDSQDGLIGGHFFVAKPSPISYLYEIIERILSS